MKFFCSNGILGLILFLLTSLHNMTKSEFIVADFSDGTQLSEEFLDQCRLNGLICLEPIQSNKQVFWSTAKHSQTPDGILIKGHLTISDRTHSGWLCDEDQSIEGRICCWFFEAENPGIGSRWILENGGQILHESSIRMAAGADYQIYGASFPSSPVSAFWAVEELRYIYPEASLPGLDDEMSALQTMIDLRDFDLENSVFDVTRRMYVDGGRSRTGIIDTGLDTNINTTCHTDLQNRISHYIRYPGSPGFDYVGHGTHIAGIIAGNGTRGVLDEFGFNLGIGIAHQSRLAISDALLAAPFPPSSGFAGMIRDIALTGAKLCNNSWNDGQGTAIGYHPNCAIWDAAVRDADPAHTFSSVWPMTIVFSAGNQGPNLQTITSPKEAKNIITVGAAGSLRAGNINNIVDSSSRGPCVDGRFAPTISAPGEAVFSTWPIEAYQQATGTSTAAAHVTGAIALINEWWKDRLYWQPSPALIKAIVILSALPVTATIPDPGHGWGRLVVSSYQPDFPAACVIDQTKVFSESGQEWEALVVPDSPDSITDIVLVWTDPPAAPGANPALVNDLDLIVISADQTYFGNSFEGQFSRPIGDKDRINNVERIRLVGHSEPIELRVKAHAIRGDGVPNLSDPSDQDFALAIKGGYLVSERCVLQSDSFICPIPHRVRLLATSFPDRNSESFPVLIDSQYSSDQIAINLLPMFSGSGVFIGDFFLGNHGRPHELSVESIDQISVIACSDSDPIKVYLPVDGVSPRIQSVVFQSISSDQTKIAVSCTEWCELIVYYKSVDQSVWATISSNTLNSQHEILITDLIPCTNYHGYFTTVDRAGNTINSLDFFDEVRWSTAESLVIYSELMDSDPMFTPMNALWQWGQPSGLGFPPDPVSGVTGDNVLGYNLEGNYENRMSAHYAASPLIDCSASALYFLSFYRWLGTESGLFDQAAVAAKSSNGIWQNIWDNPYFEIRDSSWEHMRFDVSKHASANREFQFRFQQGPTDSGITRCGWNIDDIELEKQIPCQPTPTPLFVTSDPLIVLDLNSFFYFPGDQFQLKCHITTMDPIPNLGLAVRLTVKKPELVQFYYYPDWSRQPMWADIYSEKTGIYSLVLADFYVPIAFSETIEIEVEGWIISTENFAVYGHSEKVAAIFHPDRSPPDNLVD